MKTKLIRVNIELAKEIEKIARKNNIMITEASREVANILKQKRNTKVNIMRELKF